MFYKIINARSQKAAEVSKSNTFQQNFENNNISQEWAFQPIDLINHAYRIYSRMNENIVFGFNWLTGLKLANESCTVGFNQVYQIKLIQMGFAL